MIDSIKFRSRLGRLFTAREEKRGFCLTFCSPAGSQMVLPALAEFCHASDPAPSNGDPFVQGRAAGRRDVWLFIQQRLNLTEDELALVERGKSIMIGERHG